MQNPLPDLRRTHGLSQEEVARAAGVSRQTIISIEKGRYAPNLALVFTLARIFGTTIEAMFTPDLPDGEQLATGMPFRHRHPALSSVVAGSEDKVTS